MNATASIVRILSIRDTRAFEDGDHGMRPIPGSGDARACDRCGRVHEIHARVELSDGTRATVGTGCMRGESMEVAKALASGARKATTVAKNRAIVRRLLADMRMALAAEAVARTVPMPEPIDEQNVYTGSDLLTARADFEVDGVVLSATVSATIPGTTFGHGTPREAATRDLRTFWRDAVAEAVRRMRGQRSYMTSHVLRGELRRALRKR